MSLSEADAKFPTHSFETNIPPSPSRENPGQVYPKSDTRAAPPESIPGTGAEHDPPIGQTLANPFLLDEQFAALDHTLAQLIRAIEGDVSANGASGESETLLQKFRGWQIELVGLRRKGLRGGKELHQGVRGSFAKGGMFAD